MAKPLRAGIIGSGFMGAVHAHAVRAAGGAVTCVASSSAQSAQRAQSRLFAERAARTPEELIESDDVDVVHICTPNASHLQLASAAIRAGKHVICEKPLATTVSDAAELVRLAAEARIVAAIPFAYRYYPTVREARVRIADGVAGRLYMLHGSYLQDWLSDAQDMNWRVHPEAAGASRAFGDIGVHWCDLIEFTTGHLINHLCARVATAIPERGGAQGSGPIRTEDLASVLFETDQGATGSVVISQVSLGRKNRLWFSIDAENEAYVFDQEQPDSLWVGGRRANTVVPRGPDTLSEGARGLAVLPAGHPQGYQDCFNAFVSDVHAVVRGEKRDGLPAFSDGLRAAQLTNAVLESSATNSWVEVSG